MVTVESIKPISGAGNLCGSAIINIAGKLRISDCRIIQATGKDAWVSMPSSADDGVRKWAPIVETIDDTAHVKLKVEAETEA